MPNLLCEVRFQEDETRATPGRLTGVLMTYGERASDRPEMFDPGALYFPPNGLLVNEQHNRQAPILRASPTVDGKTVLIDSPFPDTARGRDAATNLREGVLTGLSVEFFPGEGNHQGRVARDSAGICPKSGTCGCPKLHRLYCRSAGPARHHQPAARGKAEPLMPSPNLSIGEIAVSIRVATSAEDAMLDPDISFLVASIAAGVTPILDDYTTAAPQDTANLALTRMVQAVYDSEPALRGKLCRLLCCLRGKKHYSADTELKQVRWYETIWLAP